MYLKKVSFILLVVWVLSAEGSRHRRTTRPSGINSSSLQPAVDSKGEDTKYSYQPQIPPQYPPHYPSPPPTQIPTHFPTQTASPYPPQYPPHHGPPYIPQKPALSTTPYPPQYLPQTSTSKNPFLPHVPPQYPTQRPPQYPTQRPPQYPPLTPQPIPPPLNIIDQFDHRYPDGGYEFRYALPDETVRYERGYIIHFQHKHILVVKGFYSYRLPDYRYLTVFYTADQYGYRQDSSTFSQRRPQLPRSIQVDPEDDVRSSEQQETAPISDEVSSGPL